MSSRLPLSPDPAAPGPVDPLPPSVLLRDGGWVDLGDGDFLVDAPGGRHLWIRMRTGWPPFPAGSSAGTAPVDFIVHLLRVGATSSAVDAYYDLRRFARYVQDTEGCASLAWEKVDEGLLLRYRAHLRTAGRPWDFAGFRRFYRYAADAEAAGFSRTLADTLMTMRVGGHPMGTAVLTNDPREGPLADEVFRAILRLLEADAGPLLPRLCVSLAVELGANSGQFCALLPGDLLTYETDADPLYQLDLPRSKKRDGYVRRRRRPISVRLGRLIGEYLATTAEQRAQLPPSRVALLLDGRGLPLTYVLFNKALRQFFADSPFAGSDSGHLTTRRFRRTYATRLAESGASREILMDLLDHSNDKHVRVYFAMRGAAVPRIDAAVGSKLTPLARRFQGQVVATEGNAALGDRPSQRIKAVLPLGNVGIGTCGRDIAVGGLCPLAPPHACYTCALFQPWRDGPHADFAATLTAQRDELVALEGGDAVGRVVEQFDNIIEAVREVIVSCAAPPPPPLPPRRRRVRRDLTAGGAS